MFLREGLTHEQIVDRVEGQTGVRLARSSISSAIGRAGLAEFPRYESEIPWKVKTEHQRDYPAKMLRCLGRRRAGLPINEDESSRLDSWLARMERDGTVVAYDPDRGFGYVQRSEFDPVDLPIHPEAVHLD